MAKKDLQQDAMAVIDTSKAMIDIDKVLSIMTIMGASATNGFTVATNPIGLLMQLLRPLGVSYDELRGWLANFLVAVLPSLEIGVKAVLLTNLKSMVSCSLDPRIPYRYRKQPNSSVGDNNRNGIDIDIESIDFLDKLSVNPLSDEGKDLYFGLEGVEDVYKFARADDFDAFLWFVMHRTTPLPKPSKITDWNAFTDNIHGVGAASVSGTSFLSEVIATFTSGSPSSILLGNTFIYDKSPNIISICIDRKYDENDNIVENTIVPTSILFRQGSGETTPREAYSDNSVNWYIRRADQLGKNLGFGWTTKKPRDFSKERAICNLQFIDHSSSDSPLNGLVNSKIKLTILPRPAVHIPNVKSGEPPWRYKKLLFDADGNYDTNGKYTIYKTADTEDLSYLDGLVQIDAKSGKVSVSDKDEIKKYLIECYPGLTLYEFNYDYVMSMRLFDAKTMATTIMDTLINTRVGMNVKLSRRHEEATEMVSEIVKTLVDSDETEVSDCFFTFDNTKYEELMAKSEAKRAKRQKFGDVTTMAEPFTDVNDILSEYDANADLNVQKDVISRAIYSASKNVSYGSDERNRYKIEVDFVSDLIGNLVNAIVISVLSPKILMLVKVNKEMMGDIDLKNIRLKENIDAILKTMKPIIVGIVMEVRDMVLQELLSLVMQKLHPIIEMMDSILVQEAASNYTEIIRDIIEHCPRVPSLLRNRLEEATITNVDYADIDTSETITEGQPINNKC